MTPHGATSNKPSSLFLSPENPVAGAGGGGLRSASLLEYLRQRYDVDVVRFDLKPHSKAPAARAWRNAVRLLRGRPPLFDRYSGYEAQLAGPRQRYDAGVVEHFWCASYADVLRPRCERLVLDLHNIESELAGTHARAARWPSSWASARFAEAYRKLERQWLPRFDVLLVASESDRQRVIDACGHPCVHVYPNALPEIPLPSTKEAAAIVFSGNLEYHPNVEAVRWFHSYVWPLLREAAPEIEWRLVGRNPEAIAGLVAGDPRIRVIGPVPDAVTALAEARVCVVPLLSGSGTRFKILEAWAAGRAVVSTTIGAEGLGALDGENLILADSPEDFSAAVVRLLRDPDLRARLGQTGRALYLERFTWQVAWRGLDGVL
jgi:glycosyltransferase involved in cell wall biosynthesis